MYRGVHHLALVTNDLDRTIRFYRDLLGMPLVATTRAGNHRHYFFDAGGGSALAFFEWPGAELPPRKDSGLPASGRHFDHVAVHLDSMQALHELRERVRAAGVDVSEVVDHVAMKSLYFEDPNGISLEFAAPVPGLSWSALPEDPEPVAAALERA